MSCRPVLALACLAGLVVACAPTFNWRERPIGDTALTALFPCKPETEARTLPIAGSDQVMTMRSCDAGGVTFAVAHAHLSDPAQLAVVLGHWRQSTLSGLRADPASVSMEPPRETRLLPQVLTLQASRSASDRHPLTLHAVWFARGAEVFAAFVMGPALPADVVAPFFAGLQLR